MLLTKTAIMLGTAIAMALAIAIAPAIGSALQSWWEFGVWDAQRQMQAYQGEVKGGPVKGRQFAFPW